MRPNQSRTGKSLRPALELPPPFRLVSLREVGDAFAHAQKVAPEEGAGTLVYVGRFDMAEFAVVLEPEEPLRTARRAFYAGMNALADALLAHAGPEKPVTIDWPDTLRVDGGLVGGGRLAWPQGTQEDAVPDWLVFGGMIRTVSMIDETGLYPLETALDQEGFEEHASDVLVESFTRHLMMAMHVWDEDGFGALARDYLSRLSPEKGARRDIDDNGDLIVRWMASDQIDRRPLVPVLQTPSWYDAGRGGPRR